MNFWNSIFRKKGAEPPGESGGRRYFEVFGDTLVQLRFFHGLTVFLVFLALYLAASLGLVLKRPPLVIRVDRLGEASPVSSPGGNTEVSGPEVANFTEHFLRNFTALNVYTMDDDLERAFAMMTGPCRRKMNASLSAAGIVERAKEEKWKTAITLTALEVRNDTKDYISLKARGNRLVASFALPDMKKEIVFEDDLMLKKVPRTKSAPWGLLVDDWSESLFKTE